VNKNPVYFIIFFTVLVGVLGVSISVHEVQAQYPIIRIKADGSIDPPSANITTSDYITYYFNGSINASIVVERSNVTIDGAGFTLQGEHGANGFNLTNVSNVTIKNVEIKAFEGGYGIWLDTSSNNTVLGNNITAGNGISIYFWYSSNNTISGNNITNNHYGIFIGESTFNIISGNTVANNRAEGIRLYASSNDNTIIGNKITNNDHGIYLDESSDNKFYHNNFVNNTQQVFFYTSGYANSWDNEMEGNYWSNYTGVDRDPIDGIGDTSHVIDPSNRDNFPLMGMFHSFNTSVGKHVNVMSNSTVDSFEYFESNSTIRMYLSSMTDNQTFGFCRLAIPKSLIPPPISVIINDGSTELLCYDDAVAVNTTHRWMYFAYEHSTNKIVIIPEFPSLLILPFFMALTLLAAVAYRRKDRANLKVLA